MNEPQPQKTSKPWDNIVLRAFIGVVLGGLIATTMQSHIAGMFVFIIIIFCRTKDDAKVLFYAGVIAIAVRSFTYEPFNIPSGSMKSNLLVGDYLFVSKYSYGYSRYSFPLGMPLFEGRVPAGKPERGDVVVFRQPPHPRIDFIKRVMGLPGDRIQMKEGVLYINGTALKRELVDYFTDNEHPLRQEVLKRYKQTLPEGKEIFILERTDNEALDNTPEYTVPDGHYFMMGDNRDFSQDSRVMSEVGFVPAENLVGKAQIIFFSTDGTAEKWEPWKWFQAMRLDRFFKAIH